MVVEVAGKKLELLVDTGAEVTVVGPGVVEVELEPLVGIVRGVSGAPLPVEGWLQAMVKLGDRQESCSVLVAEVGFDGILGLDTLRRFGAVLDCGRNCLHVGGNQLLMRCAVGSVNHVHGVVQTTYPEEYQGMLSRAMEHLTQDQGHQLRLALLEFPNCFPSADRKLGCTPLVEH